MEENNTDICKKLSEKMISEVYPKLKDLMRENMVSFKDFKVGGINVRIDSHGWVAFSEGKNNQELYATRERCEVFHKPNSAIRHGGLYIKYCEAVLNLLDEMCNYRNSGENVLNRINRIPEKYERKILTEKTNV